MDDFAAIAKALASPTRLRILKMLEQGELCVCHLTDALGLAQPTVSKHMRVLQAVGLVQRRRAGQWAYYRLDNESDDQNVRQMLAVLSDSLNTDPFVLHDRQQTRNCCSV